jgi:hypothetical protein
MAEIPPGVVEISFPSPGNAKKYGNVTIKHIYSSILRSKEQTTSSLELYEQALGYGVGKNASTDNSKPSKLPKFFVSNIALIGNAMIAKPEAPNFIKYRANLARNANAISVATSLTEPTGGAYGKVGSVSLIAPTTGNTLTTGPLGSNVWIPLDALETIKPFYECDAGIAFTNSRESIECYIYSDFVLKKNQPFSFIFSMASLFRSEQIDQLQNTPNDPDNEVIAEEGNDIETRISPSISISWGIDYKLILYIDGTCTLFYKGSQVGKKSSISGYDPTSDSPEVLTIYPLMNSVYVYRGVPSIESTVKKQFASFSFNDPINIEPGIITLEFKGCYGSFNFSPVIHPRNGLLYSPIMKVPPGTGTPQYNSSFVGKVGSGSRGNNPKIPDKNDRAGIYKYLKEFIGETPFKLEAKGVGSNGFAYQLTLGVKNPIPDTADVNAAIDGIQTNIYSPAIYNSSFTFIQQATGSGGSAGDISSDDILSVCVQQSVESARATITLDNRNYDGSRGGKYPSSEGFTGVKYIQIKMGYSDSTVVVFTGYTSIWKRRRSGSTSSTLVIECEDVTKKAREQFAVNLPYFDGWCHIGAMAYLLKEAGFSASNTNTPTVSGSVDQMNGGCFDGHSDSQSSSDTIHAVLPLAMLGVGEPAYNFSMGTPLWSCMQRIREFTNWYLYPDHEGNIVYQPPSSILSSGSARTFREVDQVGNFDEILNDIEEVIDTAEMRNAVIVQGNTCVYNQDNPEFSQWATHVHIKSAFPDKQNSDDPFFAPYPRMAFIRNPKFEDVNRTRANAAEIFRRLTRDRSTLSFSAWGQLDLHPYDLIKINENIMNETGANGKDYVVASHTLTANGEDHTIMSTINCERLDSSALTYDPNLPPGRRE